MQYASHVQPQQLFSGRCGRTAVPKAKTLPSLSFSNVRYAKIVKTKITTECRMALKTVIMIFAKLISLPARCKF